MRAFVDEDACTGCALCEGICPEVFQMNDDFIAEVILDPVPADLEDCAREAMESCADEAITLEE